MPVFGNRGGSQLKMRLIIAAVIAIGAVVAYVSKFEKDLLTGEYRAVAMKPDQEIQMGLQAAPEMAQQMGGVLDPRTDKSAAHVAAVGQKLVQSYMAKDSAYAARFQFHLLRDDRTVNAFALPGGPIFITRGLYQQLENEDQLAGVLGHEIGHVLYRHASEHMAKGQLGQQLVGAVTVGAGDYTAGQLANAVNQMVQMKYGRQDELQSDSWGLENMFAAGYNPREMVKVMEILKRASGGAGSGPSIFASHPNPDLRIQEIKQYIDKRWGKGQLQ